MTPTTVAAALYGRGVGIFVTCAIALALPFLWWKVWRLWRHGRRVAWQGDYYSPVERVGMDRMAPASCVAFTFGDIALAIYYFTDWGKVAAGVPAILFCVAILLALSVRFFTRPRWAIPPALRPIPIGDPGLKSFAEEWFVTNDEVWRALRAARRAARQTTKLIDSGLARDNEQIGDTFVAGAEPLRRAAVRVAGLHSPADVASEKHELVLALERLADEREAMAAAFSAGDIPAARRHHELYRAELPKVDRARTALSEHVVRQVRAGEQQPREPVASP